MAYRLSRIREIGNIDFENADQLLYLSLQTCQIHGQVEQRHGKRAGHASERGVIQLGRHRTCRAPFRLTAELHAILSVFCQ